MCDFFLWGALNTGYPAHKNARVMVNDVVSACCWGGIHPCALRFSKLIGRQMDACLRQLFSTKLSVLVHHSVFHFTLSVWSVFAPTYFYLKKIRITAELSQANSACGWWSRPTAVLERLYVSTRWQPSGLRADRMKGRLRKNKCLKYPPLKFETPDQIIIPCPRPKITVSCKEPKFKIMNFTRKVDAGGWVSDRKICIQ